MTPAPENPPAFPVSVPHYGGGIVANTEKGMTLRDWFAGMALAEAPDAVDIADAPKVARVAYAIADAMLIERTQPKPTP